MSHKILVIEDDTDIQELIREFLIVQHYDVDTANDGDEGIRKFMENRPDLLILDIMLPQMDGYQVLRTIRKISSVPVIMLTALDEEADQIKGFELGVDDYITKPFSFHILNKRVEAVLRRAYPAETNRKLTYHEITVDLDGYSVYVNQQKKSLTNKEFDILKTLVENQGRVCSRDLLLNKVWGMDFYGDPRVVDTHIKNLRKKLGVPYIHTVKGVGYKLDTAKTRHHP
ncbi:response regulator transcription factor [Thermoactinomyces mirandus]|uniref:Response regulator transcription factor n=1 Tax=Thermoactinomyces mirandus TaxID=2756294 RepID=A0A7W2ARC3_9BACL|nr:response regulator transcription factor [Thermoactinomyces mirandus]MBA4602839.1 response regulator transcription factor [Thermoactinomyces mirandus]